MKKSYLTVTMDINPNEMESFGAYSSQALPLFKSKGGEIVLRTKVEKVLAGSVSQILAVMSFPSCEAIEEIFESEEYKKLIPLRDKAFNNLTIHTSMDFDPSEK
ncbi:MAG: hypothetical protein ACI9F2_000962 [Lysobacterales bacterium]|jgi:uncharacterized protein (DUF1330 family)